jgi:3D (Asp-Asp-Asp) domain-containing protein
MPVKQYVGKFELTYYCISGITKSGTHTKPHITVAVDPNVIPLGSELYIEGLGYRVAEDTGGAIKGNKIDVYVTTYDEAISNGVTPNIKVWILEK